MSDKSPLCFPLGPLSKYLRSQINVEYTFCDTRILIQESIPNNFVNPSAPAKVPEIVEMR